MINKEISLCYRKIIHADSVKPWEKLVFDDTYTEFKMQAQYFNQDGKYSTFAEMANYAPGAEHLHFLVSAAVSGYIQQLREKVPDITNTLGKCFLKFSSFHFEIINSDLNDRSKHSVAISFFTNPVLWIDTIGEYLLLGDIEYHDGTTLTNLVQLKPFLSIYSMAGESYAGIGR